MGERLAGDVLVREGQGLGGGGCPTAHTGPGHWAGGGGAQVHGASVGRAPAYYVCTS